MTEWLETIATRGEVLSMCAVFLAITCLVVEFKLDRIVADYIKQREREREQ